MVGIYATMKFVFDMKPDDVYWCSADPGWVTGHSYIVYGPLIAGATSIFYEGAIDYPDPGRIWRMIEKYGVTIFYTSPTAIRSLMRHGEGWPGASRPVDASAARHCRRADQPGGVDLVPQDRRKSPAGDRHLVADRDRHADDHANADHAAQARLGDEGVPRRRGRSRRPTGRKAVGANEGGYLVIHKPWPSMMRTIFRDAEPLRGSTGTRSPASTSPVTPPTRTRTATSGFRAGLTMSSRSPATGSALQEIESALVCASCCRRIGRHR